MAAINMTPEQLKQRAAQEAQRGIVRDENGVILRSKEWKRDRVEFLNQKIVDCNTRIKNAKAELKQLNAELN